SCDRGVARAALARALGRALGGRRSVVGARRRDRAATARARAQARTRRPGSADPRASYRTSPRVPVTVAITGPLEGISAGGEPQLYRPTLRCAGWRASSDERRRDAAAGRGDPGALRRDVVDQFGVLLGAPPEPAARGARAVQLPRLLP